MPLRKGTSQEDFDYNVAELIKSGKPKAQALAIAYRIKRGENERDAAHCTGGLEKNLFDVEKSGLREYYAPKREPSMYNNKFKRGQEKYGAIKKDEESKQDDKPKNEQGNKADQDK